MTTNLPLVTIGIPTLNRAAYIIDAVQSALRQTYMNIEVVVVDNASNDNTREELGRISDSRVKTFIQDDRVRMGENWNRCLEEASGKYFLLLSDDDALTEDAVEMMMVPFLDNASFNKDGVSDVGVVYCQTIYVDKNSEQLGFTRLSPIIQSTQCAIQSFLKGEIDFFPCSTLFRTEDARFKVGGYNEEYFRWAHDTGMWINIASLYKKIAFIPRPLAYYRVHQSNTPSTAVLDDWVFGAENIGRECMRLSEHWGSTSPCCISENDVKKYLARVVTSMAFLFYRSGVRKKLVFSELRKFHSYYSSWYGVRRFFYQLFISLLPISVFKLTRKMMRSRRHRV